MPNDLVAGAAAAPDTRPELRRDAGGRLVELGPRRAQQPHLAVEGRRVERLAVERRRRERDAPEVGRADPRVPADDVEVGLASRAPSPAGRASRPGGSAAHSGRASRPPRPPSCRPARDPASPPRRRPSACPSWAVRRAREAGTSSAHRTGHHGDSRLGVRPGVVTSPARGPCLARRGADATLRTSGRP